MNYVSIRQMAFELYRHAICFVAVIIFGLFAYQLLLLLITKQGSDTQYAIMGAGILIPAILWIGHWFMEPPTEESLSPPTKPDDTPDKSIAE